MILKTSVPTLYTNLGIIDRFVWKIQRWKVHNLWIYSKYIYAYTYFMH